MGNLATTPRQAPRPRKGKPELKRKPTSPARRRSLIMRFPLDETVRTRLFVLVTDRYGTIIAAARASGVSRDCIERYSLYRPEREPTARIVAALEKAFEPLTFAEIVAPVEIDPPTVKARPARGI
jgi:hypothetical protein